MRTQQITRTKSGSRGRSGSQPLPSPLCRRPWLSRQDILLQTIYVAWPTRALPRSRFFEAMCSRPHRRQQARLHLGIPSLISLYPSMARPNNKQTSSFWAVARRFRAQRAATDNRSQGLERRTSNKAIRSASNIRLGPSLYRAGRSRRSAVRWLKGPTTRSRGKSRNGELPSTGVFSSDDGARA